MSAARRTPSAIGIHASSMATPYAGGEAGSGRCMADDVGPGAAPGPGQVAAKDARSTSGTMRRLMREPFKSILHAETRQESAAESSERRSIRNIPDARDRTGTITGGKFSAAGDGDPARAQGASFPGPPGPFLPDPG